jgi:hypothetical protein
MLHDKAIKRRVKPVEDLSEIYEPQSNFHICYENYVHIHCLSTTSSLNYLPVTSSLGLLCNAVASVHDKTINFKPKSNENCFFAVLVGWILGWRVKNRDSWCLDEGMTE